MRPDLELTGDFIEQPAYQALLHLLETRVPFTAVFAANDQMAAGARLALHRKGLRVPDDVSLVGFDDVPASAYTIPPLTTVRQPTYHIGQGLATHLLNVVQGRPSQLPAFELSLVIRESTRVLR